jgi:hypothetical protein
MDASGPTEADSSRLDTGWADTGRADTGRPDTGRLDRRTRPTEPLRGHHMVDATGDDAMAGILALPTTAATPDRWMAAGGSAGQPPSGRPTNQDSSATRTTGTGPATAVTVSCRCYSAVQLAPRRTAVLGLIRVESRAAGSWSSVMAGVDGRWQVALRRAEGVRCVPVVAAQWWRCSWTGALLSRRGWDAVADEPVEQGGAGAAGADVAGGGLPIGMPMASCPQCVLPPGAMCLLAALLTAAASWSPVTAATDRYGLAETGQLRGQPDRAGTGGGYHRARP